MVITTKGAIKPLFLCFKITKSKFFYCINMIVLQESASAQNIDFIPRTFTSGNTYNVTIVNETTNTEVHNVDTTSITENLYYNRYNATFNLKQDVTYNLTIKSGSDVIFKDKIYCTNQTDLPAYTVNQSEYIFNDTDNEFITL